jgi:poly-gamma-glutamate synthesis protein (capsule biosynthesis protein)
MRQSRRARFFAIVSLAGVLAAEPVSLAVTGSSPARVPAYEAQIVRIPPAIRELMRGSSWRPGCPVPLHDLRLVRLRYWGFDDRAHRGRLIVHRAWAHQIANVFGEIYEARFPIRRMRLVDRYGADDMRSMRADNTSAFNCRYRDGVCCVWSQHAYGRAIDINPVENPYVGPWGVSPPNGAGYVDRSPLRQGMIGRHGPVVDAFDGYGWVWGGTWVSVKDYQHFSANGR